MARGKVELDGAENVKQAFEIYNRLVDSLFVDVRSCGAIGNGTTNDSNTFAVAKATGKNLYIPFGYTFLIDSFTLSTNYQGIFGGGELKAKASGSAALITFSGTGNWAEGIRIDGNKANQTDTSCDGIYITGDDAIIRKIHVKDVAGRGVGSLGADNVLVEGNTFRDCGLSTNNGGGGVILIGGDNLRIINNYCDNPSRHGFRVRTSATSTTASNILIENNIVTDHTNTGTTDDPIGISVGGGTGGGGNPIYDVVVNGNIVKNTANTNAGNNYDFNTIYSFVFTNNIGVRGNNGFNPDMDTAGAGSVVGGRCVISNNLFREPRAYGILYQGCDGTGLSLIITDNFVLNPTESGINVSEVEGAIIENNAVQYGEGSTSTKTTGIYVGAGVKSSKINNNIVTDLRTGANCKIINAVSMADTNDGNNELLGNRVRASLAEGTVAYNYGTVFADTDGNKDNIMDFESKVSTTDDTETNLWLKRLTSDTYGYMVHAEVWANGDERAYYVREAYFYRSGGNATQEGSTSAVTTIESDAGMDCDIDCTSTSSVRLRITGIVAKDIDWKAKVTVRGISE